MSETEYELSLGRVEASWVSPLPQFRWLAVGHRRKELQQAMQVTTGRDVRIEWMTVPTHYETAAVKATGEG